MLLINHLIKNNPPLINGLKELWTQEEIDLIYNTFLTSDIDTKKDNNEQKIFLKNIEDIITFKKKKFMNILKKIANHIINILRRFQILDLLFDRLLDLFYKTTLGRF